MAVKRYFIKLDHDWLKDSKVRNLKRQAGKGGLVDLVQLFILLNRYGGRADLTDPGVAEDACDVLGMGDARMRRFIDLAADCGLVDPDLWRELGVAASNRAVRDAELSATRGDAGRSGGEKSGESRKRKARQGGEANG